MGKHLFLLSFILGLVLLSGNALATTFVNETMTTNNATLWSSVDSGIVFNANFATSQYGVKFPITNGVSIGSNVITTSSERLVYGKQIDLMFNVLVNTSCYAGPIVTFDAGFGSGTGYPEWYVQFTGSGGGGANDNFNLIENGNVVYTQQINFDVTNRVHLKNIGSNTYLYLDDTLVYSNTSTSLNIYNTDNKLYFSKQNSGPGVCKTNAFFNNLTLTQYDAGYLANFTVRDEIGYFPINFTTLKFFLYDANGNFLQSKNSDTGMVTFTNLSSVEYRLDYHDSVYNSRSFRFTPMVYWSNYTLFIINNSVSLPVVINVKDAQYNKNLENAGVKVYKSINLTQQLIYDGFTDTTGNAVMYLNTTDIYNLVVYKSGYQNTSSTINNLVSPYTYTVYLQPTSTFNVSTITDYFTYSFSPTQTVLSNGTYQVFTFTTNSTYGMIQYAWINATINGNVYGNESLNAYGSIINITTNPGASTLFFNVTYTVKINGFDNPYQIIVSHYLYDSSNYNNVNIVTGMASIKDEFTQGERLVLVLVLVGIVMLAVSMIGEGLVIIFSGAFVFGIFVIAGWFNTVIYTMFFGIVLLLAASKFQSRGGA